MDCLARVHYRHQPFHLSLNHHRPSFPRPISSFFRNRSSSSTIKLPSIRASSSSSPPSSSNPPHQSHKPSLLQTLTPLLKSTGLGLVAAALFLTRLHHRPAIAATAAAAPSVMEPTKEASVDDSVPYEEQERALEEHLSRHPDDVEALRSLMEVRIKSRKLPGAIEAVDRLIELEPNEDEWPLLKSSIYSYSGDFEEAKKGFEQVLAKDPFSVQAYHGLVMANSESGDSLSEVLKRIEAAMGWCKKKNKKSDLRDFKLLVAQVKVMEGNYFAALKDYPELVKEEPRDFRPYVRQGIISTLLRKKDEAEKQFDKFRKIVPQNHPYREHLLDNMFAIKFFS